MAATCRIGVPEDETGELVRLSYDSKEARRERSLVAESADALPWLLEVRVEGDRIDARSRRTQPCDECQSLYFADSSKMAALCPECAHQLYDYARCNHDFRRDRCVLCFWDGSVSDYLRSRERG